MADLHPSLSTRDTDRIVMRPIHVLLVGQICLGPKGDLLFQCQCGHIVTGRTLHALDEGLRAHQRYRHLPSDVQATEDEDEARVT